LPSLSLLSVNGKVDQVGVVGHLGEVEQLGVVGRVEEVDQDGESAVACCGDPAGCD